MLGHFPWRALGGVDEALVHQRADERLDVLLALHRVVLRPAVPRLHALEILTHTICNALKNALHNVIAQ